MHEPLDNSHAAQPPAEPSKSNPVDAAREVAANPPRHPSSSGRTMAITSRVPIVSNTPVNAYQSNAPVNVYRGSTPTQAYQSSPAVVAYPSNAPVNPHQTQPVARGWSDCELAAGDELGHFVLTGNLGEGGMGSVYRAEHKLLGREVAIKVLRSEYSQNREALVRFFREAQAVNLIQHPNIVDVTDFVEQKYSAPFIVMELLEGTSLDQYIQEKGPLTPDQAIDVAEQICDAMHAVHGQDIVHRDLKPANMMVVDDTDGRLRVKLLDFGVAKFLGDAGGLVQTATGLPVGTPEFMSPEQIRGEAVDHRADVYALGGILFFLLTGHAVFDDSDLGETLQRQVNEDPRRPSEALTGAAADAIPEGLDELVLACLVKEQDLRIQNMGELLQLLRALRDNGAVTPQLPQAAAPKRAGLGRWIAAGVAALALVAAGALGVSQGWLTGEDKGNTASQASAKVAKAAAPKPTPAKKDTAAKFRLESLPAGASVYRKSDGRFLGRTPLRLPVPAAGKTLGYDVRQAGYQTAATTVTDHTKGVVTVQLLAATQPSVGTTPATAAEPVAKAARKNDRKRVKRARDRKRRRSSRRPARRRSIQEANTVNPFQ